MLQLKSKRPRHWNTTPLYLLRCRWNVGWPSPVKAKLSKIFWRQWLAVTTRCVQRSRTESIAAPKQCYITCFLSQWIVRLVFACFSFPGTFSIAESILGFGLPRNWVTCFTAIMIATNTNCQARTHHFIPSTQVLFIPFPCRCAPGTSWERLVGARGEQPCRLPQICWQATMAVAVGHQIDQGLCFWLMIVWYCLTLEKDWKRTLFGRILTGMWRSIPPKSKRRDGDVYTVHVIHCAMFTLHVWETCLLLPLCRKTSSSTRRVPLYCMMWCAFGFGSRRKWKWNLLAKSSCSMMKNSWRGFLAFMELAAAKWGMMGWLQPSGVWSVGCSQHTCDWFLGNPVAKFQGGLAGAKMNHLHVWGVKFGVWLVPAKTRRNFLAMAIGNQLHMLDFNFFIWLKVSMPGDFSRVSAGTRHLHQVTLCYRVWLVLLDFSRFWDACVFFTFWWHLLVYKDLIMELWINDVHNKKVIICWWYYFLVLEIGNSGNLDGNT